MNRLYALQGASGTGKSSILNILIEQSYILCGNSTNQAVLTLEKTPAGDVFCVYNYSHQAKLLKQLDNSIQKIM